MMHGQQNVKSGIKSRTAKKKGNIEQAGNSFRQQTGLKFKKITNKVMYLDHRSI
jgi:hypothetical protein